MTDHLDWAAAAPHFEAQKPCANGCTRTPESDDQPAEILGARHGALCDRCYWRMHRALALAGEVVEHIRSLITTSGAADGERVDSTQDAPVPINAQALHDSDEIYARLVHWTRHWARQIHATAPAPVRGAHTTPNGQVVGLPAAATPAEARDAVEQAVLWLHVHLEEICDHRPTDDVNYFGDELREIYSANARWPRTPQPYYSKLPCPDDGARIAVYPPTDPGSATLYKCEQCGRVFDEERHAFYSGVFTEIELAAGKHVAKKHFARSSRVRKHLSGLYGTATTVVLAPSETARRGADA